MNSFARLPQKGLLSHASERLLTTLAEIATTVRLNKGAELFAQGDPGDALYVVDNGQLEVSVVSSDGRKLSLDMMEPGDVLGEIALFDDGERTATITARTAATLRCIRRRDLHEALEKDPTLGVDLTEMAGRRMRWLTQQIHEAAFLPLAERLARKILHLTAEDGGALAMSQADLADFVGASREAVSKTLATWRQGDIIDLGRGKLSVKDRTGLRILAGFDFF